MFRAPPIDVWCMFSAQQKHAPNFFSPANLTQLSQTVSNDLKPFFHSESSNLQKHCGKDIAVAERTQCLIGNISLTTPFIKNFLCIVDPLYHGANQHSIAK